jgi:hypothetical protein
LLHIRPGNGWQAIGTARQAILGWLIALLPQTMTSFPSRYDLCEAGKTSSAFSSDPSTALISAHERGFDTA